MTEVQQRTDADGVADGGSTVESLTRQFVTFICNNEVFAVDMAPVQEIIRVPETVRVPMAPSALDGLANLRGKVLPIVSLARTFGFEERAHDDATRAVVIDLGQPLGFVVDRVASVVNVESHQMSDVDAISATVNSRLLKGLLKDVGGHPMTMVLDFEKVIASEFAEIAALAGGGSNRLGAHQADTLPRQRGDLEDSSDELQLVSFAVAGQEYAIAIENVQEIVQMPDNIVRVPGSQAHVVGVMTLRQRLLPLVSLRRMFGLPEQVNQESGRIVVVSLGGVSVGVVMDTVNEVLRVNKSVVDPMPALLAREDDMSDISQICRIDGGKRLVSIISADNMFRRRAVKEAIKAVEDQTSEENGLDKQQDTDDEEQMVVFRLDQGEFGVPIDSVQEIVRVPEVLTHVPRAPAFVEGVINLRGSVLPVIDQRVRLGLPAQERNDRQRIMVFLFDGVRTGFIVDSVTEVLKIHRSAISAAPRLSGEQARLIGRVANLEKQKRLIQLLDPSRLLDGQDVEGLSDLLG
ncbi:chemotaxis protein CheW [Malikia sp.]|uniref:chemotaxis protein CheW n=1 Tax=Malikia sp. TaxID=2070706 RepID=UPI002615D082|nr:chemotaxis protein CheW [Malikia sp.]MDD2727913.1 chemotaxis protein CheW [Malikia sp.]